MRIARWSILGIALCAVFAFGIPSLSAAEMGVKAEIATAVAHAQFAQKYDTTKEVTMHLHHVLNCLVGPADQMYDKAAGDPCQGQGKGILPDIKSAMGADQQYQVAWWLARLDDQAIKMGNLAQAKAAAHIIEVQLTSMSKM